MYDIIHSFIRPSILGGSKNRLSRNVALDSAKMNEKIEYQLLDTHVLSNDVLIESIKS